MNLLHLSDVTLCIIDCWNPALGLRALKKTQKCCTFSKALFFSHERPPLSPNYTWINIDRIRSRHEYSFFILKKLNNFITTNHILIIQWDGYVVEPRAWIENFKRYDYIGARWEQYKDQNDVGNGGFSLRSKKLLEALSSDDFPFRNEPEDLQICRVYRQALQQSYHINFATTVIADAFSYETIVPYHRTFGFHGVFNLWRHNNESELMEIIQKIDPHELSSKLYFALIIDLFSARKFGPMATLYRKQRSVISEFEFISEIFMLTKNYDLAILILQVCKKNAFSEIKQN